MVGKVLTAKELQSMKVVDLRHELRFHGLKVSGLRQELIDRLAKHLKSSKRRASASVDVLPSAKPTGARQKVEVEVETTPSEGQDEGDSLVSCALPEVAPPTTRVPTEIVSTAEAPLSAALPETSLSPQSETSTVSYAPPEVAPSQMEAPTDKASVVESALPSAPNESSLVSCATPEAAPLQMQAPTDKASDVESMFPPAPSLPPQSERTMVSCAPPDVAPLQVEAPTDKASMVESVFPPAPTESSLLPQSERTTATQSQMLTVTESATSIAALAPLQVKLSLSPLAKAHDQSTPIGNKKLKPRVAPRAMAFSPLSPGAVLAPEVSAPLGTPSKDDAVHDSTPMKDAQRTWRELCAREAACLRCDRQGNVANEQSRLSPPREKPNEEIGACDTTDLNSKRSVSRSRSPQAHTRPKVSKIVLKKRRSLEHPTSEKPPEGSLSHSKRPATRSPENDSHSQSPARGSLQRGPRNCLWGRVAPNMETESSSCFELTQANSLAADTNSDSQARDQQQLQKRAAELRSELLSAFNVRTSSSTGAANRSPSRNSRSPHRKTQLQTASTPDVCPETPNSVAPSPFGLVATPRLLQRLAAANLLSPGPSPRNLSSALQDVAHESKSSSCREQALDSRQRMLVQLTEQMQKCLTRLQDPHLDDGAREKYQSIATSIRGQIDKISSFRLLGSSPAIRRGGC